MPLRMHRCSRQLLQPIAGPLSVRPSTLVSLLLIGAPACTTDLDPIGQDGAKASSSTSGSSQTGTDDDASLPLPLPDTPLEPCRSDADCSDFRLPACDRSQGKCVRCTDSKLHCENPSAPHCGVIDGIFSCQPCFENTDCAAAQGRPYCHIDDQSEPHRSRCVECLQHQDCTSRQKSRCQLHEGLFSCAPCDEVLGQCPGDNSCLLLEPGTGVCTERVIYVQERGNCETADGTKEHPFCHVMDALNVISPRTPTTIRVPQGEHQPISYAPSGELYISLVGSGDFVPTIFLGSKHRVSLHGFDYHSGVILDGGAKMRLSSVNSRSFSFARLSDDSHLWIDRSSLTSNKQPIGEPVFELQGSKLWVSSSVIADLHLDTQSPELKDLALVSLNQGSQATFEHVTIVNNDLKTQAPLFRCKDRISKIALESSLVLDFQTSSQLRCIKEQLTSSHVISDLPDLVDPQGASWDAPSHKPYFRAPDSHDYGLSQAFEDPEDPLWNKLLHGGIWTSQHRPFDLDGARWPQGPGAVGADQP